MSKLGTLLLLAPLCALASEGVTLDRAPIDTHDVVSLQRGAQVFVNYCLNCHSANFMRFNRLRDIGLTDSQIKDNLMFAAEKVGEPMSVAMRRQDAFDWFGVAPPDLSVVARARGADWLYTYLRTFYRDASRPTGWNNVAFPGVGMPHVLYQLQGARSLAVERVEPAKEAGAGAEGTWEKKTTVYDASGAVTEKSEKIEGHGAHAGVHYLWGEPEAGKLGKVEYDQMVADLVNYLVYMGEPARNQRVRIGIYALLFLGILLLPFAWLMKREFWKDVH